MTDKASDNFGQNARRLRLDTLIGLRWMAVVGQSAALLLTHFGLGFSLPILLAFIPVLFSAVVNLGLRWTLPANLRLRNSSAALLLGYDVIQLSLLLYLTGGLQNPFAILFLAPVIISAVSLPTIHTVIMMILMIVAATIISIWNFPLPWYPDQPLQIPLLYVFGTWIALILGAVFAAIYASRVAREAHLLADALAATELALAREQHLTQLDGLAAAAAHELGTPLATITVVAKEMESLLPPEGPLRDDVHLLSQEIKRCRDILGKLRSLEESFGGAWDRLRLTHLLDEILDPVRDFGVSLTINKTGQQPEPICRRNPGIVYGLGNLVENAVDFAQSAVIVTTYWDDETVTVEITDDGPGFAPEVLNRLGEPYVTTRADRRAKTEQAPGLGLGLFVAKTLLERSGATMSMENVSLPGHGALVILRWRRGDLEIVETTGTKPAQETDADNVPMATN